MYWDVKVAKPLADYNIYVEIEDGRKGLFDMKPYLNHGVFKELKNIDHFNQVNVFLGALTWPNQQDVAPETLVEEMKPL